SLVSAVQAPGGRGLCMVGLLGSAVGPGGAAVCRDRPGGARPGDAGHCRRVRVRAPRPNGIFRAPVYSINRAGCMPGVVLRIVLVCAHAHRTIAERNRGARNIGPVEWANEPPSDGAAAERVGARREEPIARGSRAATAVSARRRGTPGPLVGPGRALSLSLRSCRASVE